MTRRLLVTGPIESLDEFSRSARASGWDAIEFPLLAVHASTQHVDLPRDARFDVIAITSRHALPFLEHARATHAALRTVACAVVGERTAIAVEALGFALAFPACASASELALRVHARASAGSRVLWPRGQLSDELARTLRAHGHEVLDPIVYSTQTIDAIAPPPRADAVFFASPSAVRAWHEHGARWSAAQSARDEARTPPLAIAIGPTTFDALLSETRAEFFDTISLPRPTPEALGAVLAHLDPPRH